MKTKPFYGIDGVHLLPYFHSIDERGSFSKLFSGNVVLIDANTLYFSIKEVLVSSSKKNVIRGMHLQIEPYASNKIVIPFNGEVLDVLLDLRADSKTFLNVQEFRLISTNKEMLYIPKGVAHGFKVLSKEATLIYLLDSVYNSQSDTSINPLSLNYDWELDYPIISNKDKNAIDLSEFIDNQRYKL